MLSVIDELFIFNLTELNAYSMNKLNLTELNAYSMNKLNLTELNAYSCLFFVFTFIIRFLTIVVVGTGAGPGRSIKYLRIFNMKY